MKLAVVGALAVTLFLTGWFTNGIRWQGKYQALVTSIELAKNQALEAEREKSHLADQVQRQAASIADLQQKQTEERTSESVQVITKYVESAPSDLRCVADARVHIELSEAVRRANAAGR